MWLCAAGGTAVVPVRCRVPAWLAGSVIVVRSAEGLAGGAGAAVPPADQRFAAAGGRGGLVVRGDGGGGSLVVRGDGGGGSLVVRGDGGGGSLVVRGDGGGAGLVVCGDGQAGGRAVGVSGRPADSPAGCPTGDFSDRLARHRTPRAAWVLAARPRGRPRSVERRGDSLERSGHLARDYPERVPRSLR